MKELAALAQRFAFNHQVLTGVLDGFDSGDWAQKPSPAGGNTAHWILGHIAGARRSVLRKLGDDLPEAPWEDYFARASKPTGTDGYPSPEELFAELESSDAALARALERLTDKEAGADWGQEFPDGGSTIADGVRFFYFHEIYHVGQLGLFRRITGKPGFA